jgi:hypothetical protein
MWPWEHLAFGYVVYSLTARIAWRRSPGGVEAAAVVLATQLPDLIDKPLSWGLGVFPAGYAMGHSIVVAVPLSAAAIALARRRERVADGLAFAVGYLSHLAGDLLSPLLSEGRLAFERVLWPFVSLPPYETTRGFAGRFLLYVGRYAHEATEPENWPLLVAYLGLFVAVGALWMLDGAPGVRELVVALRASVRERS